MTPKFTAAESRDALKRISQRISPLTRWVLIVLAIVIPDWFDRGQFWYGATVWLWPFLRIFYASTWGKSLLLLIGFLLILFDQCRITRKRATVHDLFSLKGRTLKLRDDLQAFINNVPTANGYLGASQEGTIERLSSQASFVMGRLEHGYILRFHDRVTRIYHEFGERGVQDKVLTETITNKRFEQLATHKTIIEALSRLAQCPEASNDDLNSLTPPPYPDAFREDMSTSEYRKARAQGQIR